MKLLVLVGNDNGFLKQDHNTPVVAIVEVQGMLWEGRGNSPDAAKQHLAKRLNDGFGWDINVRNPDFEHVKGKLPKCRYDT